LKKKKKGLSPIHVDVLYVLGRRQAAAALLLLA